MPKTVKWSPKSLETIVKRVLAKINLLHGSVRSSKSYTADFIATQKDLPKMPPCNVLISGFTSDSAKQNIISEWEDKLKNQFKEHRDTKGLYYTISTRGLHDKRFYIRGGGKSGDEKGIKGVTLGYWYADEITEQTKEFVNMALSRLSLPYSRAIWTTNPSAPNNFIKTDYIDKAKQGLLKGIFQEFSFCIYDNPTLPVSYIRELETMYHGVFYERNIRAKWVAAEGHIYTMLDDDNLTDFIPSFPERVFMAIDYGTSNMTVFNKVYLYNDTFYVVDEYSHSGMETQSNKAPSEYVDDLKDFIGLDAGIVDGIYPDPSANYFITECKKSGIGGFKKSNNDIIYGIQIMQNMFAHKRIKIHYKCKKTIESLQSYKWDLAAQLKGEDVPVKKDDHFCDALRYIFSSVQTRMKTIIKTTNTRVAQNIIQNY